MARGELDLHRLRCHPGHVHDYPPSFPRFLPHSAATRWIAALGAGHLAACGADLFDVLPEFGRFSLGGLCHRRPDVPAFVSANGRLARFAVAGRGFLVDDRRGRGLSFGAAFRLVAALELAPAGVGVRRELCGRADGRLGAGSAWRQSVHLLPVLSSRPREPSGAEQIVPLGSRGLLNPCRSARGTYRRSGEPSRTVKSAARLAAPTVGPASRAFYEVPLGSRHLPREQHVNADHRSRPDTQSQANARAKIAVLWSALAFIAAQGVLVYVV